MSAIIARDQWRWMSEKGDLSPWIRCPLCAQWIPLIDYEVGDKGTVTPTCSCPHLKCTFSDDVVLEQWKP